MAVPIYIYTPRPRNRQQVNDGGSVYRPQDFCSNEASNTEDSSSEYSSGEDIGPNPWEMSRHSRRKYRHTSSADTSGSRSHKRSRPKPRKIRYEREDERDKCTRKRKTDSPDEYTAKRYRTGHVKTHADTWARKVNVGDFDPEDIQVKTDDDKILIEGNREISVDGDEDALRESDQLRKEIQVEKRVELSTLRVIFQEYGYITLKAKRKLKSEMVTQTVSQCTNCTNKATQISENLPVADTEKSQSLNDAKDETKEEEDEDRLNATVRNIVSACNSRNNQRTSSANIDSSPKSHDVTNTSDARTGHTRDVNATSSTPHEADSQRRRTESTIIAVLSSERQQQPPVSSTDVDSATEPFEITVDLPNFKPKDIKVKVNGLKVTVHAKHTEEEDEYVIQREVYRSYNVPKKVNPATLIARLDSDGKLRISEGSEVSDEKGERTIPVLEIKPA